MSSLRATCLAVLALLCFNARADEPPPPDNGLSDWALLGATGDDQVNGSSESARAAHGFQQHGEALFYFRHDGKAWLIRDAATLARIKQAWAPVSELGEKMGALGGEMGKIGGKQGAIGAKMGALGEKMGALSVKLAFRRTDAEREKLEKQLADLQAKMDPLQHQIDVLQEEMEPLQKKMEGLEPKMTAAMATSETQLRAIVDDARAKGLVVEAK